MSTDPYHAVQQEIETSMQTAVTLRASFLRIRNMTNGREETEELRWARSELKATLAALEADLEDLEQSVKIVESTDVRLFGLTEAEAQGRRQYVEQVKKDIENMRAEESGVSISPDLHSHTSRHTVTEIDVPGPQQEGGVDHEGAWAREEQQMMIREQDRTMDSIAGTLSTLAQQAGLMGREIGEQVEMLEDLEEGVDRTDSKLGSAMHRMRRLVRDTEEKRSGLCIGVLTVILVLLLLAVILA